jgi:hypothetical protein
MEDDLQEKWKTNSKTEDDLKKLEDDLNKNGKQPRENGRRPQVQLKKATLSACDIIVN